MKKRIRKRHSAQVKAQVALAAMRERETTAQIAVRYGVHPTQVSVWKKQAKESLAEVFSSDRQQHQQDQRELVDELYKQIGQLTMQLDWLKKKSE
jgi:transposase-like protein